MNHDIRIAVGISGGTGSGKTTLARGLSQFFGAQEVCLLDEDSYYRDRAHLSEEARARVNYDEPQAIDQELLLEHVRLLLDERPVQKPIYNFKLHGRDGYTELRSARLIVVEGLFTLCHSALRELLKLKIYVDADPDIRFIRRMSRDVLERGRSAESVIEQYLTSVRPMHYLHVEPCRFFADLVLKNNASDASPLVDKASKAISRLLRSEPSASQNAKFTSAVSP
jgi:uridine kinase